MKSPATQCLTLSAFMILFVFFIINSCLDAGFTPGRSEIVSVSDSTLNDSSLFTGHIYLNMEDSVTKISVNEAIISIKNLGISTSSDSSGYYHLTVLPGTYTLQCQDKGNQWSQLIEEIKNVKIRKNEIIRIAFYLGSFYN